jgi:hypothetical protein
VIGTLLGRGVVRIAVGTIAGVYVFPIPADLAAAVTADAVLEEVFDCGVDQSFYNGVVCSLRRELTFSQEKLEQALVVFASSYRWSEGALGHTFPRRGFVLGFGRVGLRL